MNDQTVVNRSSLFERKTVLITGGTGSLGKMMVKSLLRGDHGMPSKIIVMSRDEAKQHFMRLDYLGKASGSEQVLFDNFKRLLEFRIGDVRDFSAVCSAVRGVHVVINAAALKQVPSCEYFPIEAVQTNVLGAQNVIRAVQEVGHEVEVMVGVSTDKACKPVNVMGMSKALQERLFVAANLTCQRSRFVCVRYGNVLASRGSVIPMFHQQIADGGPVTVTDMGMTRFLMPLSQAVDTICAAIRDAQPGETFIPIAPAARIHDVATALVEDRPVEIVVTGIRPGEKLYESLVSEEERVRTSRRSDYYAIASMLPELQTRPSGPPALEKEYTSDDNLLTADQVHQLLRQHHLLLGTVVREGHEILV